MEPSQALTPAALFGTGQIETIVSAIESQVRAEAYDITTPEGRERIKSVAYKIARSKTTLDEIGKEHVAEIKAQSAAIDKERKTLRDRLDALKEEVRKPVTDWEDTEANRVSGHENAIVRIIGLQSPQLPGVDGIRAAILEMERIAARDWQEFEHRGIGAYQETRDKLAAMLAAAERAEAERAELEALRAEKAAREEADRKAAAEQEAAAAAARHREQERIRAERAEEEKAAAVARAVEQERQRAEEARIEAGQRAEREKAAAIEAERRRLEEEARAEEWRRKREEQAARDVAAAVAAEQAEREAAERKRQESTRHRNKVHRAIRDSMTESAIPGEVADLILAALIDGSIPHVSINY
ncbi:hypothetical protein [Bradyrhizobium sp. USDA 4452]